MKRSLALILAAFALAAQTRADELAKNFTTPPASARPWVYLFENNGNITSNGITADLEAMARVGIGGVIYFEVDQLAPKGPVSLGSPQRRDLIKHLCSESKRLGLQVNMNNGPGWTGSGGPWITPELSMQRVVWSETSVTGPQQFNALLSQPKAERDFYRDIAVFAYPTPVIDYVIPCLRGKSDVEHEEIFLRTTFPLLDKDSVIAPEHLVNLTAKLGPDGRLAWEVPEGKWTVLRLGYTTTGQMTAPATASGLGLECDKLSKAAVEAQFNGMMAKVIADVGRLAGENKTLVSTHIDSWEVGSQNWTPKFQEEFRRLCGYDSLPFLPVLTGRVVDTLEVSERFLWDVRQTVADLVSKNYAGHMCELANRNGLRLTIEAYGSSAPTENMTYAAQADEPMGEFWAWTAWGKYDEAINPASDSCREMSSAAHVYGKRILGAEAFTSIWSEKWLAHPANIKNLGDWAFCEGINRFVFHRYAQQPWTNPDRAPGMSFGPWGLHYERTQTWWEQSKAWHEYLARCQYLLQQGLFVADLCLLTPERQTQNFAGLQTNSPLKPGEDRSGYNFDLCPAEAVITRMTVKDGRLVMPDGMSYRMLVLPKVQAMTPQLLRKIRDLVQAGATVLGMPPVKSPSLQDYPKCDAEVESLARELWGDGEAPAELTTRNVGKGRVIWGRELQKEPDPVYPAHVRLGSAKWIWFNEGSPAIAAPPGKRYFRRVVTVDAGNPVESCWLQMAADNTFECWVNGSLVGSTPAGQNFNLAVPMNLAPRLKPGANLITVCVENTPPDSSPAGLLGTLAIVYRDGRRQDVFTDNAWQSAKTVSGNWTTDPAPASGWSAALELGPMGMAPWGEVAQGEVPGTTTREIIDLQIASGVLAKLGVSPDFKAEPQLRYIHKDLGDTEVYFVANPKPHDVEALCSFRVSGKQPELWQPDTGRMELAAAFDEKNGVTSLPLRFEPNGSVFVVFRGKAKSEKRKTEMKNWPEFKTAQEIAGPWEVSFDPKWGGPTKPVTFDKLEDWSKRAEEGIRYYSGTATYRKTFELDDSALRTPHSALFLDLGKVAVIAEVKLNGKDLGILWKPPFRVDISGAVKSGENSLEVKVVNLWINRMIGDEQLPEDSNRKKGQFGESILAEWPQWLNEGKPSPTGRFTFTSHRLWKKTDALVESGLIGPVTLQRAAENK